MFREDQLSLSTRNKRSILKSFLARELGGKERIMAVVRKGLPGFDTEDEEEETLDRFIRYIVEVETMFASAKESMNPIQRFVSDGDGSRAAPMQATSKAVPSRLAPSRKKARWCRDQDPDAEST